MEWLLHTDDAIDGRLFAVETFTQRLVELRGSQRVRTTRTRCSTCFAAAARSTSPASATRSSRASRCSSPRGTPWSAEGGAHAVSVLVHDPEPASSCAVVDMRAAEKGTATAGREFVLGATPDVGCAIGHAVHRPRPAGRAPDHFHRYDEVIYILEGEGRLEIDGQSDADRPRQLHPPPAHARARAREHRRFRAAAARRLPPGGLACRGLLPRRHLAATVAAK